MEDTKIQDSPKSLEDTVKDHMRSMKAKLKVSLLQDFPKMSVEVSKKVGNSK